MSSPAPAPPPPSPAHPAPPTPPPSRIAPAAPLSSAALAAQTLVCGLLGGVSRLITHGLNTTVVVHGERFAAAHGGRGPGQGLLTASNHVTAVDDPGIIAPLVPPAWLVSPERLRWTLCAADRCFTSAPLGALLGAGRVLPVERGGGARQPHMDAVVARLAAGDWVHMFPEGARQWPPGQPLGRLRPGLGRLIADAHPTPLVVPLYHDGMQVSAGRRGGRRKEGRMMECR